MNSTNQALVTQFIIAGFPDLNGMQGLLFVPLVIIYIFTVSSNLAIITIICTHHHFHVPLYLFVAILSFLEIWYTTVTIPKMLAGLLNQKTISYVACILQVYFLHVFGITETYLLTAMAYDRYMAICNPLRYASIMTASCCFQLIGCCWVLGFFGPLTQILLLSQLSFCGSNKIEHIFCDFTPLMNLSCSDPSLNVNVDFTMNSFLLFFAFFCIILSYIRIISAVLKINSTEGRQKAFSTCSAHLTVVMLFFGSVAFVYIRLTKHYPANYYQVMAVVYSVLTPMCNPIIYSLRNREIRELLSKKLTKSLCNKI
ncbi:olfactory receptor 6N2-like [Pelobates fuscus]|uniref:olfactory receptor 6N2-like n=1 Tax=Pelobates fuscus TaxID=191477 RepID=UPI002FE4627C